MTHPRGTAFADAARPNRGAILSGAAAAVAVALVVIATTAFGLARLEDRLATLGPSFTRALLAIPTAHAASVPRAPLLIRSHQLPITAPAGSAVALRLGFKNMSGRRWVRGTPTHALLERERATGPSRFLESTWIDTMRAAAQEDDAIDEGALAFFTASLRIPVDAGTYQDRFVLRSLDGTTYAESTVDVVVIATTAGSSTPASPETLSVSAAPTPSAAGTDGTDVDFIPFLPRYTTEPTMRVGIARYDLDEGAEGEEHRITANVPFRVVREDGQELMRVPAEASIGIDYHPSSGIYHISRGTSEWLSVRDLVRIIPDDPSGVLELRTYTKRLHWEGNTADNLFRGILEIRYVPTTNRLWAINELPLEQYLRGLVETSDDAPEEFHNAQVIAARTFALYHIERGGKYAKGQFILTNSASDQVYRGENAARRRPNLVRAVEATRGVILTYDGDIAVTPYYAQSDGRTRAWHEVWGGPPKAWLTSVADPVCEGKRKIGHGVGMPQRCAMELARQGARAPAILRHYYAGARPEKVYE